MMKVEVQSTEPCRRVLHLEIPEEDVRKDYEAVVCVFLSEGMISGFRKGKAPRALIERKYAKSIDEEFRRLVIPKAYREAIQQEGLPIVSVVDVQNVVLSPATGLVCDVTVDVMPEFELPQYQAIPLKKGEDTLVSGEQVEEAVNGIRSRLAEYLDPPEGYEAAEGDVAQIDYEGAADGQPLSELVPDSGRMASGSDVWITVGSESALLPGQAVSLAGSVPGSVREFEATFGEEEPLEAIRGRTVHYRVTVKSLRQRKLPDLDEAFCNRLGMESPEAVREVLRRRLEQEVEQRERNRRQHEVSEFLLRNTVLDVPRTSVERETRSVIQEIVADGLRNGVDRERIAEQQEALVETARQTAERRLKLSYILLRIADAQQIESTEHELNARISDIARTRDLPEERIRAEIEDRYGLDSLKGEIRVHKAMDWLLSQTKEG